MLPSTDDMRSTGTKMRSQAKLAPSVGVAHQSEIGVCLHLLRLDAGV